MAISEGSSAVTWPSVLLRPSTHQVGASGWLGAERSARSPKGLFAGETAFAVELLVTGFHAEGVVLVLYGFGQLGITSAAAFSLCYICHCTFVSLV